MRHPRWDYSHAGYYFVTICTKGMYNFFGKIENGVMQLNGVGKIVAEEWLKTEEIRKSIKLDQWCVMPNHFHTIIVIQHNAVETPQRGVPTVIKNWKPGSLGAIINQFKSICTKRIRPIRQSPFRLAISFL